MGFPDDDPDSTIPPNDPNLLKNRPVLDRAIVISAGVIANLIFAYFLLVVQLGTVGGASMNYLPGVKVPEVAAEVSSAAKQAGIRSGDVVLSVDGKQLGADGKAIKLLVAAIQDHPNQPLALEIQRQEQKFVVTVTPEESPDGKGRIGVQLTSNGTVVRQRAGFVEAFSKAAKEFERIVVLTVQGFGQLLSNFSQTADKLSGCGDCGDWCRDCQIGCCEFVSVCGVN